MRRKSNCVFFTLKHHTLRGLLGEQACYNGWACFPPGLRNWAGDSQLTSEIWTLKLPCSCPDEGGLSAELYCSLHKKWALCHTGLNVYHTDIFDKKDLLLQYITSWFDISNTAHIYTPLHTKRGRIRSSLAFGVLPTTRRLQGSWIKPLILHLQDDPFYPLS